MCPTSYLEDGELFASERQDSWQLGRCGSATAAVALTALELRSGAPRYSFIGGKRG